MKTRRRLLLVGAFAAAGVLGLAAPAFGAESGTGEGGEGAGPKGHAEEECIHILEGGGSIDDCQEAPSPVLPELNEIIWGGVSFLIVFGLLAKFAFPALKQTMAAREERIRSDLEGAEQARTEAEGKRAEYQQQLADARAEAGRIIEEARVAADQVRRDLIAKAEQEANEVRGRAQEDIRLARERAMADLQRRAGEISIELAEKIVERNLDRDTQMALVESYIDQVGSN